MDIMGERLKFLDIVQRIFTEGGPGGGHILPRVMARYGGIELFDLGVWGNGQFLNEGTFLAATMIHAGRDETLAMVNKLYAILDERTEMSPYELRASGCKTFNESLMEVPRYRFWLLRAIMPALGRACILGFRGKAEYEATLTVLALKRWRLDKGAYPEKLAELVADGYLQALPDDPYGEGSLKYRRVERAAKADGDPSHALRMTEGDDFVLYSLGADFDDDGGRRNPVINTWAEHEGCGDHVFWPVQ